MSGHMQHSKPKKNLYNATIHTCTTVNRSKVLTGLAALVVDVSLGSGETAFTLPFELYEKYIHVRSAVAMEEWEEEVLAHYRKMYEKYPYSWMRILHNPNIAFMEKAQQRWKSYDIMSPRQIAAKYYMLIMKEPGYLLTCGHMK